MKVKTYCLTAVFCCFASMGICQNAVKDGLTLWTTAWDDFNIDTEYWVYKWTYSKADSAWSLEKEHFMTPEVQGEQWSANVFDMGMDMIVLKGRSDWSGIFSVSQGDSHFPSTGTEFQHRRLNANGEWESVQPPLFSTVADISPLGVDIYYDGDELHIAWTEDNDEAGPKSLMCEIYDQAYTVNADGTLTAKGDKKLAWSRKLNWGASHPGLGGVAGLTVCDFDGDGDMDFIIGNMFYGDSPAKAAIQWIERLGPTQWATNLKELWVGAPGHGAEGVCYADIDGDQTLDLIITSGGSYAWNIVVWFEKNGNVVEQVDSILDCNLEASFIEPGLSIGHIFGLFAPGPQATEITDWSLFQ
ncbi:MAG: FG-GAP-like repeat-containing protein [Candidatus Omnitrophota bacterium]